MSITIQDCKEYLGIDWVDSYVENNLTRCIATADSYLKGSLGEDYPPDEPRVKELALMIVADLYDSRGSSAKVASSVSKIYDSMCWQLRLEMRRGLHG